MREGLALQLVHDAASLQALEPEWRVLWEGDPAATPFQSPEWLLPWWRQFGHGQPATIAIRAGDRPIGLLPFYVYVDRPTGARRLLLIGAGTSDYLDGVFAPQCTGEDVSAALHHLAASAAWDEGWATQLRPGSKLLAALSAGGTRFATDWCSRMPAAGAAALPRKIRHNVAYYGNRAGRMGLVEYRLADSSNCLREFETLVALHNDRWRTRSQGGLFHDRRVLAWHREAVPLLARRGVLRLYSLRLAGETIAAMYCMADPPGRPNRSLYVYIPAFAPSHAALSPGTLLLAHAVERAAAEGIQTVDLLRGNEHYKRMWHMEPALTFGCAVPARVGVAAPDIVEAAKGACRQPLTIRPARPFPHSES